MTPRLSGHFSIFGLVFFVLKSLLGMEGQWSRENLSILTLNLGVTLELPRELNKISHSDWLTKRGI